MISVKSTENLITHNIKIARNSLRTPLPNSIGDIICNLRYGSVIADLPTVPSITKCPWVFRNGAITDI